LHWRRILASFIQHRMKDREHRGCPASGFNLVGGFEEFAQPTLADDPAKG